MPILICQKLLRIWTIEVVMYAKVNANVCRLAAIKPRMNCLNTFLLIVLKNMN